MATQRQSKKKRSLKFEDSDSLEWRNRLKGGWDVDDDDEEGDNHDDKCIKHREGWCVEAQVSRFV